MTFTAEYDCAQCRKTKEHDFDYSKAHDCVRNKMWPCQIVYNNFSYSVIVFNI